MATMILYLGLLAGLLQLIGYVFYLRDDDIEPNPATWLMFAYGTMLLTMLEWDRQATIVELFLPLVCSGMAVVVAARCWLKARRREPSRLWPREWWPEDRRDRLAFQSDLMLTALYVCAAGLGYSHWISEEARNVAVLIFLIATNLTTFSGFFPLIRCVYVDPGKEREAPWAIWTAAYAMLGVTTYLTHGHFWSELMLYPIVNALLHGTVAVLVRRSRRDAFACRTAVSGAANDTALPRLGMALPKPRLATEVQPDSTLRLSHGLVALHVSGIALLILVVLGTASWLSMQHNRLALESSRRLMQNEIESIHAGTYTLVRDYSLWDQGFAAVLRDDRDWLYSSIGSSVT
jgi:hypothetical protein